MTGYFTFTSENGIINSFCIANIKYVKFWPREGMDPEIVCIHFTDDTEYRYYGDEAVRFMSEWRFM